MRSALILAGIICAHTVSAQSISGTVYDPSGALVVGARVILMDDYVKQAETRSGPAGEFRFEGLRAQLYLVQIKQARFSLYQSHVDLAERRDAHLYAVLPLANMGDSVRVVGDGVSSGTAQPVTMGTRRVGGEVQPARVLRRVPPAYPAAAKQHGAAGAVAIHARITAEGRVTDPLVLASPDPDLESAALAAVRQSEYEPMRLNGRPVPCDATIVFEFSPQ